MFTFGFSTNLLVFFLAGLNEVFLFSQDQSIIQGIWHLWLKKGLFLWVWGLIAWLVGFLLPLKALFLPVFILFFLVVRALSVAISEQKNKAAQELDRLISDPVIFIPALIAGYTHITFPVLCIALIYIWLGVGTATLILLSIRRKIELERGRKILILLLSTGFMAMILTALQQSVIMQFLT